MMIINAAKATESPKIFRTAANLKRRRTVMKLRRIDFIILNEELFPCAKIVIIWTPALQKNNFMNKAGKKKIDTFDKKFYEKNSTFCMLATRK